MTTIQRAEDIAQKLEAQGIRATTDPTLVSAPGVLLTPPNLVFDLACGASATWTLVALAPAANTADHTSWAALDEMVDAIAGVVDLETADVVAYVVNGRTYPAYLCQFTEGI
jgi:hypothetical protein